LSEADLGNANLSGANLSEANLSEADLSNANLSGANLREVDLREADLRGIKLKGAGLSGANLKGARLTTAADIKEIERSTPSWSRIKEIAAETGEDPRDIAMGWAWRKEALLMEIDRSTTMPNGRRYGWFNKLEKYTK